MQSGTRKPCYSQHVQSVLLDVSSPHYAITARDSVLGSFLRHRPGAFASTAESLSEVLPTTA